jgi:hypothetical protein
MSGSEVRVSPDARPAYPGPQRGVGVNRSPDDEWPSVPPSAGNPVQGDYGAVGGREAHHDADGGTGLGHQRPADWPVYHERGDSPGQG